MRVNPSIVRYRLMPGVGGGGGSLLLETVPDARESPSQKHPKQGLKKEDCFQRSTSASIPTDPRIKPVWHLFYKMGMKTSQKQ